MVATGLRWALVAALGLWLTGCDDGGDAAVDMMTAADASGGVDGAGGAGGAGGMPGDDAGPDAGCPCPGQQTCDDAGGCVEPAMCADDIDCLAGRLCLEGACRAACTGDGECGDGERCDPEAGVCVLDERCADDGDCPDGACVDGECVAPCMEGMCPGQQTCDPATGDCIEPDACADDIDCIDDRVCLDGACARPCGEDADCPGAQACIDGQCAEPEVCTADVDCLADRLCVAGACADPCGRAGCPGGLVCDGGSGRCEEADPCADDDGCFPGRRCADGLCVDPCVEDAECVGAESCIDGMCVMPSVCDIDAACGAGRVCIDGMCQDGCPAMACPDGAVCDEGTGRCVVPGGCVEAADCQGAQSCEGGRCVEPAVCNDDLDCLDGRVCRDGACVTVCARDVDCPGSQLCEGGECIEGPVCEDDGDCLGARRCDDAIGACVDPCPGGFCPGGLQCVEGWCAEPASCLDDVDCAGERICRLSACFSVGLDGPCDDSEACPDVCVDFACAEAAPGTCDCPDGWACDEGSCAAPAPCGNCPDGWHCADDGRCLRCTDDRHCPGGGVCDGGVCIDPPTCEADGDCLPGHLCPFGRCEIDFGACVDDPIGRPAPDRATPLPPLALSDLRACDGISDWFRVGAADGAVRVTVRFAADVAPPRVRLYDALDGIEPLVEAEPQPGEARVAGGPGDYLVEVRAAPGASVAYGIEVEGGIECAADRYERPWPNDDAMRARAIAPGVVDGTICPGDEDWFTVDVPRRMQVDIEGANAEVDGRRAPVEADGPLTIRVSSQARADYRLTVRPIADPVGACAQAGPLALGVDEDATVEAGGDDFAPACGAGGGSERVFVLDVPRDGRLTAELPGIGGALYLYADCADAPVACSAAAGGIDAQVEAGRYFLVVDGPYAGTVRAELQAASPLCADPPPLEPGSTAIMMPVGPPDIGGDCTDPDLGAVVRRVEVPEASVARLSLVGGGADALVSLRAECGGADAAACGVAPAPSVAPRLQPGTWFAVIQAAPGELTAELALEPAGDVPGFVDACDGAPLAAGAGADLPLEGDLTMAGDTADLALCNGLPGSPDGVLRFTVDARATVVAFVEEAAFGVRLAIVDANCGAVLECGDAMTGDVVSDLMPGTYGLVLEADGLGGGPFRVRLQVQ